MGAASRLRFSDNYEHLERYAPYFVENGGDLPSHLAPEIQSRVKELVARRPLRSVSSTVRLRVTLSVHNGEPYVIELAARLSGGFFCTRESRSIRAWTSSVRQSNSRWAKWLSPPTSNRNSSHLLSSAMPFHVPAASCGRPRGRRAPGHWGCRCCHHSQAGRHRRLPAIRDRPPQWCLQRADAASRVDAANDALSCLRIATA